MCLARYRIMSKGKRKQQHSKFTALNVVCTLLYYDQLYSKLLIKNVVKVSEMKVKFGEIGDLFSAVL